MKAAALHALGQPPRCEDFADPQAIEGEVLVRVTAASLKNVDKMMASSSHYDRLPHLPCVCGIDGVGLLDDGTRVYCGGTRPPYRMMAERANLLSRLPSSWAPRGWWPPDASVAS